VAAQEENFLAGAAIVVTTMNTNMVEDAGIRLASPPTIWWKTLASA